MGSNTSLPEAFLHLLSSTNAQLPNKAPSGTAARRDGVRDVHPTPALKGAFGKVLRERQPLDRNHIIHISEGVTNEEI